MCSVSGDDNCVNAEEEVGGWDPLPDIIWYVRPSANSRRLKKKWEGRIGADEWKDSKGVLLHSCRHLTKRSEVWHSKNACRHDNWALPSSTPHFFPLFFFFVWNGLCRLSVCYACVGSIDAFAAAHNLSLREESSPLFSFLHSHGRISFLFWLCRVKCNMTLG
jgi:hypothetical protein